MQRATKFVKYLPEFGWTPIVLTVKNPSVPVFDESLVQEIPDFVEIVKTNTLEPSYQAKQSVSASADGPNNRFSITRMLKSTLRSLANSVLQPDPQILWLPSAIKRANRLITQKKIDAIIATAPPFSSLLLGAFLAKKHKIPLLLDYRDEWDISNSVWENKNLGTISLAIQQRMQGYILRHASAIVATTKMSAETLRKKTETITSDKEIRCIYNGYDAIDFQKESTLNNNQGDKYVLTYVGTLWNLTSIEPVVFAIQRLLSDYPDLAESLELVIAGRRTKEQELLLDALADSKITLTKYDYLNHESAVQLMLNAKGLCLLLSDIDLARRVVPAKTFEYMATGNSIFVIAPKGEVWDLLDDYPRAYCAEPSEVDKITVYMANEIRQFIEKGRDKVQGFDPSQFERRELTGQLANLLNYIADT